MIKFSDMPAIGLGSLLKRDVAIIDLDNCISDDKWRWSLFDLHRPIINERYERYHEACESDSYSNSDVIKSLARQFTLVAFTARPESVRIKTRRWLNRWRVPAAGLFMRPNDNHESSVNLKREMLNELRTDTGLKIFYAIDDRVDILDMYADEGVNICQRVFINEPEIAHP